MEAIRRSPYAIAHLPESMKSPDLDVYKRQYMTIAAELLTEINGSYYEPAFSYK